MEVRLNTSESPHGNVGRKKQEDLEDEEVLFLTDIFPTGWAAIDWCKLKGGKTVVIFGSGPVGLMAQKAAWLQGAERVIAVDPEDYRLDLAKRVNKVETLNARDKQLIEKLRDITGGRGPDAAVDAVGAEAERSFLEKLKAVTNLEKGTPKVMELCFEAVRRGSSVAVVGVYGSPYDNFHVHRLFDKGINVSFGQSYYARIFPNYLGSYLSARLSSMTLSAHRLPLKNATHAYDIFKKKK